MRYKAISSLKWGCGQVYFKAPLIIATFSFPKIRGLIISLLFKATEILTYLVWRCFFFLSLYNKIRGHNFFSIFKGDKVSAPFMVSLLHRDSRLPESVTDFNVEEKFLPPFFNDVWSFLFYFASI